MASDCVTLGFLKLETPWVLPRKFFPSKVGGKPTWLKLSNLPDRRDLLCPTCKNPLSFLLQVYSPIKHNPFPIIEMESYIPRTIFIFMCPNGKCCRRFSNDNFLVFRSQLPFKLNAFNNFDEKDYFADQVQPMCIVCGCAATLKCSNCNERDYCCEIHHSYDWENGHKALCGKEQGAASKIQNNPFLLPESELEREKEKLPSTEPEKSDEVKMNEFPQSSKAPKEMQDMPLDDLDSNMERNDIAFIKFQKRVSLEPEQVLRFQKGGSPLWVSSEHVPEPKDISNCICGAKRIFEFQVMPQLLNFLSLDTCIDSVDWGTLAVYTCSESCNLALESYVKEFLWKQDFSDDDQKK